MPNSESLAVLILNWNRRDDTRRCVESCDASQKVFVLNNGCVNGQEYVADRGRRVTILDSPTNLGYAAGVNLLASQALAEGAEWLMLLNNDAVLGPGAAETLVALAGPDVAAVCPMVIDPADGRVWSVGGRVSARSGRLSSEYHGWRPDDVPTRSEDVDFGTGACLLISGQAMREIGGLDTTFFAYWEETDWCRRARDAGFRIVTCPAARAIHVGGASSSPSLRLYLMTRNALLYMRRHASRIELARFIPVFLLWTLPTWSVRPLVADPRRTALAIGRALTWHGRRRIPNPSVELPPASTRTQGVGA